MDWTVDQRWCSYPASPGGGEHGCTEQVGGKGERCEPCLADVNGKPRDSFLSLSVYLQ